MIHYIRCKKWSCRKLRVLSVSLRYQLPIKTPSTYRVAEQNGFRMLTEIINDVHNRLRRYVDEINRARNKLQGSISEEHLADLQSEISNNIISHRSRTRSRLQRKFKRTCPTVTEKKPSKVVNLSSRQLNNTEITVFSRGLKYNSADAICFDFLGNPESILQGSTIPEDVCSDIRNMAASQLRNKNATHPTTADERRAIHSL